MFKKIYNISIIASISIILLMLISCEKQTTQNYENGPVQPRVIFNENPMTAAVVSWTTLYHSNTNKIYYDTVRREANKDLYSYSLATSRSGKVTLKPMDIQEGVPEGWYHHAELTDLQPGTAYYFVLESDGGLSDEFYFITAPENPENIKLLAGGDSRLGGEKPRYAGRTPHVERQQLKTLIGQLVEENPDIVAFVHGADYGTTADWRHLYWYFEDLQLATNSDGRLLPMLISMGNHDTEFGFMENFWLGEEINDKVAFNYYYTSQLTNDIALITLNTEISLGGMQYHWLIEELPLARDNNHWLLLNYHKPAFPAHKDPEDYRFRRVREYWVPLFEESNVDLVIESDGHTLKRTAPIRNGKVDPTGIVYIGEGGLGAPLREPDTTRWFMQGGFAMKAFHVWMIDIDSEKINLNAFSIDKDTLDTYTVIKNK
jgi:acid phosphatase type 7